MTEQDEPKKTRQGMMMDITPDMANRTADIAGVTEIRRPRPKVVTPPTDEVVTSPTDETVTTTLGATNPTKPIHFDATWKALTTPVPEPASDPAPNEEFRSWWAKVAQEDFDPFYTKLKEYGSHDLLVVGLGLHPGVSESQAIQAGIAFYLLGKAARAVEAARSGRPINPDTFHDMTVYSMMARRVQVTGKLA